HPQSHVILQFGFLTMTPVDQAVVLDPIVIEGEGVVPRLSGFEQRRTQGFGSFVTRDEFAKWNTAVPTDILRRLMGVRVRRNPLYGVNGDTRRWLIESRRDVGQRITQVTTERVGSNISLGNGTLAVNVCPMLVFRDGVYLGDSNTMDVDHIVSASNLAAIEAYSPSQVPPRFALAGSTCGVVVFWTR
ncbi:MAG: hypothetical protein OER77_14885, partial [Myxococcales bacterium]|nr:hypothetical protein [Myxococcales bacterium]